MSDPNFNDFSKKSSSLDIEKAWEEFFEEQKNESNGSLKDHVSIPSESGLVIESHKSD